MMMITEMMMLNVMLVGFDLCFAFVQKVKSR